MPDTRAASGGQPPGQNQLVVIHDEFETLCGLARDVIRTNQELTSTQHEVAQLSLGRHVELANKIDALEVNIRKTQSLATWLACLTILTCIAAGAFGALLAGKLTGRQVPTTTETTTP
jgi:hypothetical protein